MQYWRIFTVRMIGLVLLLAYCSMFTMAQGQQASAPALETADLAVMASVRVVKEPPAITLSWPSPQTACTSYTIYRRLLGEHEWLTPALAVLPGDALRYTDTGVATGIAYEYRIDRDAPTYRGSGYVCAGIELPLVDQRGSVLLLVDNTLTALETEVQRLQQDLLGDGWRVIRLNVPRTATVLQVKQLIETEYRRAPHEVTSVLLLGHIAVPYSGDRPRDGHPEHTGAWATDVFYGTMELNWTDTDDHPGSYQNHNALRNWNKPGDGKYDIGNLPPQAVQLQVGRIDLSDMPSFRLNEIELLRQYLNKDHRFRQGQYNTERRGVVRDGFGTFGGSAFACGGWYNQAAVFGAEHVTSEEWFPTPSRSTYPLMGYGCGGGSYTSCDKVGNTTSFVEGDAGLLFTMLFGSWFGDWDNADNLLRAVLASANGGLTCVWSGYPPVFLHHMGLGQPIGYSILRSQNNDGDKDYPAWGLLQDGRRRNSLNAGGGSVTVSLMGDPTLRLFVVAPPTKLTATADPAVTLHWQAAADAGVSGYLVYRGPTAAGPFTRLTETPIRETRFTDVAHPAQPACYMVKAVKLEQTGSGTFYNASQGVFLAVSERKVAGSAPAVKDLSFTLRENRSVNIRLQARGAQGHPLVFCVAQPQHGTLTGKAPKLTYTPARYYSGSDTFSYTAFDAVHESTTATVTLHVSYVEAPPLAQNLRLARHRTKPVACPLPVVEHHNHPVTYQIVQKPRYGTLSGDAPALVYTPTSDANVADSFTFTASNDAMTSAPAKVLLEAAYPCRKSTASITVDGDIREWPSLPYTMQDGVPLTDEQLRQWKNRQDCDYRFGVCYDDAFVYVGLAVTDDQVVSQKDKYPWEQDGIEIRIDARPEAVRFTGNGSNELVDFPLFAMCPMATPQETNIYEAGKLPPGCKYACVRTKEGYAAEIAVPRTYFIEKGGKDWTGFRLNVGVNDSDSSDDSLPVQYYRWKPDWRSWSGMKSYDGSGSFLLQ